MWKMRSLLQAYQEKGYDVYASFPTTKDYNMDLMTYHIERETENSKSDDEDLEP